MEREIRREAYLAYARTFTETEQEIIREFAEWLPRMIIDCHAHCNLPQHVRWIDDRAYRPMLSTFPSFSLEESKEWHALLHPGKAIRTLRFPETFRGIDHRAANLYLLAQSPEHDRIALYGLPDDPDYTMEMLGHPRVSALKMYYSYLEPPATEIYQYFPKVVLEAAQKRNIPIILHPPKRITMCMGQILKLIKDFPRLRICLAHLSLTKQVVSGLEDLCLIYIRNTGRDWLQNTPTIGWIQPNIRSSNTWGSAPHTHTGKHFLPSRQPSYLSHKESKKQQNNRSFMTTQNCSMTSSKKYRMKTGLSLLFILKLALADPPHMARRLAP